MKTKTIKYLLFLSIALSTASFGQNLVPNPSFEQDTACPIVHGDFPVSSWSIYRASPDYYNSCVVDTDAASVPHNLCGFQCPSTGKAYAGIITYEPGFTNYRECFGAKLISPLNKTQKYYISFKINSAYKAINSINGATNKLGVLFSTIPYSDTTPVSINNFAHIYSSQVVTDTANWTTIKGSFTADSIYKYIIVGNFFDDSHITHQSLDGSGVVAAYYFVDDVCVSTDSNTCNIIVQNNCSGLNSINNIISTADLRVFPNPFTGKVIISTPFANVKYKAVVYDVLGIKQAEFQLDKPSAEIDLTNLADGNYFIQYIGSTFQQTFKIIKTSNH